jgi:hypothetical protein
MPPVLGWSVLQPVEPAARLCKFRVLMPGLPVCASPPRADDYPSVWFIGRSEELSSDPTWSLLRRQQTSAHRGVPFTPRFFLQVYMGNDRHHRVDPPWTSEPGYLGYWITSSARCRSEGGIVKSRAVAVLRLITSSNSVGCCMGRSPGLAPLRILSTYVAAR